MLPSVPSSQIPIVPSRSRKWPPVLKRTGALAAALFVVRISPFFHIPYAPWCWNIYLHLPQKSPKCRQIFHTWSIWAWWFWMIFYEWTNGGLNHEHMVVLLGLTLGDVVLQTNLKLVHDIKPKNIGFCHVAWQCRKIGDFTNTNWW